MLSSCRAGDWLVSEKAYRPNTVSPPHTHDYSNLSFVMSGALMESTRGAAEECRTGSWVRKPAGVQHGNRFGPEGARLLELVLVAKPDAAPPFAYGWRHAGMGIGAWLRIYRELRLGDGDGMLTIAELAAELRTDGPAGDGGAANLPWVGRVLERLHATEEGTSSLSRLAADAGIHPTYLARAFRRRFGVTVGDYSRNIKVARAASAMAGGMPLADVAQAAGFADQSHLTRIFKARTGMSPGAFRALLRPEYPVRHSLE
ncbi:AraC family transcriptional regulator, partial [bacterium]|nr:AraC family transcriptional regulator [bacterium]